MKPGFRYRSNQQPSALRHPRRRRRSSRNFLGGHTRQALWWAGSRQMHTSTAAESVRRGIVRSPRPAVTLQRYRERDYQITKFKQALIISWHSQITPKLLAFLLHEKLLNHTLMALREHIVATQGRQPLHVARSFTGTQLSLFFWGYVHRSLAACSTQQLAEQVEFA